MSVSWQIQLQLLLQCGAAALCGAAVGVDRERAGKPAGVRTHMLVSVAAALAVGAGRIVLDGDTGDSTRVLHGVLTGVGFIGAGAIIRSDSSGNATGLTTAATVLLVAVLGACCALGLPVLAFGVTVIALATLRGVKGIENVLDRRQQRNVPHIETLD
jgi:putative Mg2+ transporter-C (MgtC) family protein